jgi:hypothetical protein
MRMFWKTCGTTLSLGLVFGLACVLSGCDSGGDQKTEYKPIESNILKKLGSAGQAQSDAAKDAAKEKMSARGKRKN